MTGPDPRRLEIENVLEGFLNSLRDTYAQDQSLSWLVDEIAEQIHIAESISLASSGAFGRDQTTLSDTVLTSEERLTLALRVVHHHLVSLPRMWAYTQNFWTYRQSPIVLYADNSDLPLESTAANADRAARQAHAALYSLATRLDEQYGLRLRQEMWLRLEEEDVND